MVSPTVKIANNRQATFRVGMEGFKMIAMLVAVQASLLLVLRRPAHQDTALPVEKHRGLQAQKRFYCQSHIVFITLVSF